MNNEKNSNEMLDWDKKNVTRFAQFLYDLAKERVQTDGDTTESIKEEEVVEELIQLDESLEQELLDEPLDTQKVEEEIVEEDDPEVEGDLEQELEEVTIGLAKAVSGEDVGEIDVSDKEEIRKIIEKEQIPIPSENITISTEDILQEEPLEVQTSIEQTQEFEVDQRVEELESVDLSQPIVTDPVINKEVFVQPENIPIDIHNLVFVEEATSIPITKDEIIISDSAQETEIVQEVEIVQEAEVVQEPISETDLDFEAASRRQKIIDSMLAETKKREDEEGFKVRELGETEGRAYSAVVFGNESNKNIKKWRRWEKRRLKEEKKKRKRK